MQMNLEFRMALPLLITLAFQFTFGLPTAAASNTKLQLANQETTTAASRAQTTSAKKSSSPPSPGVMKIVKKRGQTHGVFKLPNDLEVLVVSDPNFTLSSAALSVKVGTWSDPVEHPGLAHFLEHMLFMGTKKYPQVGEFKQFLESHLGYSNASTFDTNTSYRFQIESGHLREALDRFSQFFISPLFDPTYTEKEKTAVHNEYESKINNAAFRLSQVLAEMSPNGHPFRKFIVGSRESLARVNRTVLLDFYEKHYSANAMKLVLTGPQKVEELQALAKTYFSKIPNRKIQAPDYSAMEYPIPAGQWAEIKPLSSANSITLFFPVRPEVLTLEHKSLTLFCHMISTDQQGSFYSELKRKYPIQSLSCYNSPLVPMNLVELEISFTPQTQVPIDTILAELFRYVELIKTSANHQDLHTEIVRLREVELTGSKILEGADDAQRLSKSLFSPPALEIDESSTLMPKFNSKELHQLFNLIHPRNMSVIHVHDHAKTTKVEPYYRAEYSLQPLNKERLSKIEVNSKKLSGVLQLSPPKRNPYAPTNLALLKTPQLRSWPVAIQKDDFATVWYLSEQSPWAKPKSFVGVKIYNLYGSDTPERDIFNRFHDKLVGLRLSSLLNSANKAGITIERVNKLSSIEILAYGPSQYLLKTLINYIKEFSNQQITEAEFNQMRSVLGSEIKAARLYEPFDQTKSDYFIITSRSSSTADEIENALNSVTIEQFRQHMRSQFRSIYPHFFVYGNTAPEEALDLSKTVYKILHAQPLPQVKYKRILNQVVGLNPGQRVAYFSKGLRKSQAFMSTYQYFNADPSKRIANLLVIRGLLKAAYYTEMRSNQKLGYSVGTDFLNSGLTAGLQFRIESTDFSATDLAHRSDEFLKSYSQDLIKRLKFTDIEPLITSYIHYFQRAPQSMVDRFNFYIADTLDIRPDFNYQQKLATALKAIQVDEIKQALQQIFGEESQTRFNVYYSGQGQSPAEPNQVAEALQDEVLVQSRQELLKNGHATMHSE